MSGLRKTQRQCLEMPKSLGKSGNRRQSQLRIGFYAWLQQKSLGTTKNADITKAIEYCFKRWQALTRYLDDGNLPIDNNWAENQMRPWALGRKNWLFAGSLESGQRAASIMSLIQSARLNGLDPYAYLADVLRRLPTHPDSQIDFTLVNAASRLNK